MLRPFSSKKLSHRKLSSMSSLKFVIPMLFVVAFSANVQAVDPLVKPTTNLLDLGEDANSKGIPIVLVYTAEDCEHCERLDEDVLRPLAMSGEMKNSVIIRKIMVDSTESIVDFNGQKQSAGHYSMMHHVGVTPTMQFVDGDGHELVPKIVGYQVPDMFFAYFEQAVAVSQQIIKAKLD